MLRTFKKSIALFVALVFILSLVPFSVMAEETKVTDKIYFTNYSFTRKSGSSYLDNPGSCGVNGETHDIRFGGQYYGYAQLDLTGYEEILANDNTSIKVSVYAGPYTTTQRKCGDFYAYLVNDKADASYVAKKTTQRQADNLGMHKTDRPILFTKSDGTVIKTSQIELDADKDALLASLNEGADNSLVTLYFLPKGTSADSGYLSPSYINPRISYLEISYDESEVDNQGYVDDLAADLTWDKISSDDAASVKNDLSTLYKGATISWESSVPGLVTPDGKIVPSLGIATDATFTATITYKGITATKAFDVTVAPEEAVSVTIPFTNYAYSRSSATNISDAKNHVYAYETFGSIDCIQTGSSFDGYVQLDLKGYEEIINDPTTTATVTLECGYQYSTARLNPVIGRVAPDSADGYDNMTITWNIAQALGMHKSGNPELFRTTESDLRPDDCAVANADMAVLVEAINSSTNSVITLYLAPNGGDSKIRASKSGLTISYFESQIDNDSFFANIEESFSWETLTTQEQNAVVNDLYTYYKGADIVWSSAEGYVTSSGELAIPEGNAIVEDTVTANVSYNGNTFTKEFAVKLCDGSLTLGTPALAVEGGVATGSFAVTNATVKDVTYQLYLAVYSGDELVELVPVDFTIAKGSADTETVTANVADGAKVKFLVWEYGKVTPVTVAAEK